MTWRGSAMTWRGPVMTVRGPVMTLKDWRAARSSCDRRVKLAPMGSSPVTTCDAYRASTIVNTGL
jgi:hypothetical protein